MRVDRVPLVSGDIGGSLKSVKKNFKHEDAKTQKNLKLWLHEN